MKMRMVKMFALVMVMAFGLGFGKNSFADPVTVQVNSFLQAGPWPDVRVGEVCGVVTGLAGQMVPLHVIADYNSSNPGHYAIYTTPDGKFCHLVHTYYGTVEVSLFTPLADAGTSVKVNAFKGSR